MQERERWVRDLCRLADPVLSSFRAGAFKERMPVEHHPSYAERAHRDAHLECFARLLSGLAPWLELGPGGTPEAEQRARYIDDARHALASAVDPASPDVLNFTDGPHPVVDAAYLASALLRAPHELWDKSSEGTQGHLMDALIATRSITPYFNNWILFAAQIEAAIERFGGQSDHARVDLTLNTYRAWYLGDGIYGDGPEFHFDYYNSFVIQPLLIETIEAFGRSEGSVLGKTCRSMSRHVEVVSDRYAEIQERMIAPDGSFPPVGRSITYRCGAFHLLALKALRNELPPSLPPQQVRAALGAVIRRTLDPAGTFTNDGWLQIGLSGHQPDLGERYINTGSLYMASLAFLPLGLPPDDPFWSASARPWTSRRLWTGANLEADDFLSDADVADAVSRRSAPTPPLFRQPARLIAVASVAALLVLSAVVLAHEVSAHGALEHVAGVAALICLAVVGVVVGYVAVLRRWSSR